jgi:hypothetical protein
MTAKSKPFFLAVGFIVALNLFAGLSASHAQTSLIQFPPGGGGGGGEFECKWSGEFCPDKQPRDVCLKDGPGASCVCGTVSCTC